MSRYCGVVVWFNPDKNEISNINSYIDEIEKLYIVDNSLVDNGVILEKFDFKKKCEYIALKKNTGLAHALNLGCNKAIIDGFTYVLTMDQDSIFEDGAVRKLKVKMNDKYHEYAIICPNVISLYWDDKDECEKIAYTRWSRTEECDLNWAMTSGCLMSLNDYLSVGGFDEEMFIAHLDIDIGIKFNLIDKKILMIGNAVIMQHFGNSQPRKILWKTVHPSFASPARTYYLFRNQMYLEKKYGKEIKKYIGVSLWKFVVKILLFESDKIKKVQMMFRARSDAKKGKMGEYK